MQIGTIDRSALSVEPSEKGMDFCKMWGLSGENI